MIVNESFLDSATLRENVVSLARNIGYVPRSRNSAKSVVSFSVTVEGTDTSKLSLQKGLVCNGIIENSSYLFSIVEDITVQTEDASFVGENGNIVNAVRADFDNIEVFQGTFLTKQFTYDGSLDQRFILDNSFIDTASIKVYVDGVEYRLVDNIINVTGESTIFLIQEIQDEKYELLFGDGLIGKKLQNADVITVNYLVTDGEEGNGASFFSFAGRIVDSNQNPVLPQPFTVNTVSKAQNGSGIEKIDSIKYFAPKIYSAQNRAVTGQDYEAIIKEIYPDTESVSIVGGEELDPPEFGTVQISIKPKNGQLISEFNKSLILSELKNYSVSGIKQNIIDLKVLYVELDSFVYYDDSKISTPQTLKTKISNTLNSYANSLDLNKFGGRFKYSKVLRAIDDTDTAITSNITRVKIRRNLNALLNQFTQYELCFGNQFHVNDGGFNIKSTGFTVAGESGTVYFTDVPNPDRKTGLISVVKNLSNGTIRVISKSAGTVDYIKGEINIGTINITSTEKSNNVIEVQAIPESNDVVGLRDIFLKLDISNSEINMLKDVISSGEEISGTVFRKNFYTSSYSNGKLIRE